MDNEKAVNFSKKTYKKTIIYVIVISGCTSTELDSEIDF
jgi:hypothetical protein